MEETEAWVINFERLCRLCLHEKRILTEIFESSVENNNFAIDQKIMAIASVDLDKDDGLPTKICIKCLENLNAAFDFRIQCENADRTLRDIHKLLRTSQVKREEEEMAIDKDHEKVESEKEDLIKSVDLSHVIIIRKHEKQIENEDYSELLGVINDSEKKFKFKERALVDVLISDNQKGTTSIDSLTSPVDFETKRCSETSNGISFNMQSNSSLGAYRIVINSSEERKDMKLNDSKLNNKKNKVSNNKKSACPFCKKMLTRVDDHIRLLHRNRVYICSKHNCGAKFLTLKNLQSHQLRCYNLEKAYKCFRCLKEFHRKSNYKAHIRRHSDIKNFQCQLCERAFVDSTGLRRHFLKHHEPQQETFISGCCGKKFKSREGLKKHIQKGICGIQMFHVLGTSKEPL